MHAHVAGAVAEGKHRLAADLLRDLKHLVGLEVLDQQLIRADDLIEGTEHIIKPVRLALPRGLQRHVHSDDVLVRNVEHALDEDAADEPVAAGADIALKPVFLQVFHDLHHRQIEAFRVGHAVEAVRLAHENLRHKIGKVLQRHARVGARRLNGMLHRHIRREGIVERAVPERAADGKHFVVRLDRGILQDAPCQHVVFQIRREQLAHQRSVHVEHGDPVRRRDIVRRILVRDRFHISDQRVQRRRAVGPFGKDRFFGFLGLGGFLRKGKACRARQKQQRRQKERGQGKQFLTHVSFPPQQ